MSSFTSKEQEDLINAYEAEEERIINLLSRKLEQLREEKIGLENQLEAESESHVNRLSRELSALRSAQQQHATANGANTVNGSVPTSPDTLLGTQHFMSTSHPGDPSPETLLEAMRRENEQLRNRLVDTERDYIRISRLNEIYREELIEHRKRLGLPVDNLIGIADADPFSQPTHRRSTSSSNASSPSTSVLHFPMSRPPSHGVPIPRPPSQIHRPISHISESNTPPSHSSASSESPFPLSPLTGTISASLFSNNTTLTSPPSSSFLANQTFISHTPSRNLTYPSVPPPSLSSSFGSPTVPYHIPHREASLSPAEPLSRRNSNAQRSSFDWRVAESGSLRSISQSRSHSRRESVERGGRVAETGSLVPRGRAGSSTSQSHGLPSTTEAPDGESVPDSAGAQPDAR